MVSDGTLLVATSALAIGVALFAFTVRSSVPNQKEAKSKTSESLSPEGNGSSAQRQSFWRWWLKPDTKNEKQGEKCGGVNSARGLLAAIGNTPLIRINSLSDAIGCEIFGKCEFLNPGGSVKDRVAVKIIEEGLRSGQLQPGGLVCEGSAGSTGVSLALVARTFGCRCFVALPDDAAIEKSQMLEALGAQVERVRPVAITHPGHFVNVARRKAQEAAKGGGENREKDSEVESVVRAADFGHKATNGPEKEQRSVQPSKSGINSNARSKVGDRPEGVAQKVAGSSARTSEGAGKSKQKQAKGGVSKDGPKFLSDGSAKKARKARKKQLNALNEMVVSRVKRGPDFEATTGAEGTDSVALEWGEPWFDEMGTPGVDDECVSAFSDGKINLAESEMQLESSLKAEKELEASRAKSELPDVVNGVVGHCKASHPQEVDNSGSKKEGLSAKEQPDGLTQRMESVEQEKDRLAGIIPVREAEVSLANSNGHLSAHSEGNGDGVSREERGSADHVDSAESLCHAEVSDRAAHLADDVRFDRNETEVVRQSATEETVAAEVRSVQEKKCDVSSSGDDVSSAGMSEERPSSGFFADQFENLANFRAHYEGTGPEIWAQTGGKISAFVAGAGTGGTLAGISCYLKEQDPGVKCFLVDPPGSGLYYKVTRGVLYTPQEAEGTRLRNPFDTITEGIGINRLTRNFEQAKLDGAFRATDQEAVDMARYLLLNDGLFVGSSSAVNCVGAFRAAKALGPGHVIVTILCDGGQRHLSKFHNSDYLKAHGLTRKERGALPLT